MQEAQEEKAYDFLREEEQEIIGPIQDRTLPPSPLPSPTPHESFQVKGREK